MNIRDFVGILRELSFTEIRHEAIVPPRILIVARSLDEGANWRSVIFGANATPFVEITTPESDGVDPLAYDALLSIGSLPVELSRRWAGLFRRANEDMRLVEVTPEHSKSTDDVQTLRRMLCDLCRDRSVAFGRYMDEMREAATFEVVSDTSRVNAQFAALSNIPALIPLVGGIFAAGADFLVLTKNQLMMTYRLAAIYDRDLDDRWRVYAELAPVIGAGFAWRTAARQIAAVLPFAIGAVPKVAIAYTGTYAIGHAARMYYLHGVGLDSEELAQVYRDGLAALESARDRIQPGTRDEGLQLNPALASSTDGD